MLFDAQYAEWFQLKVTKTSPNYPISAVVVLLTHYTSTSWYI